MSEHRPPTHGTDGTTVAPVPGRERVATPRPAGAITRQVILDLVGTSPPDGHLRADGRDLPFTGWLELLAAIETAIAGPAAAAPSN